MKCKHILFAHAFLGCDTTSALYGLGKPQAIKMLESEEFVSEANTFQSQTATRDDITVASDKGFLLFYKANKLTESLNELRNIKFNLERKQQYFHKYFPLLLLLLSTMVGECIYK